jgi:hypothetical protein
MLFRAFIVRRYDPAAVTIAFIVAMALTVALFAGIAKVITLICRAVLEFLPPWLDSRLGIRRLLLLQVALLFGGSLSLLCLLAFFAWLTFLLRANLAWALVACLVGLTASAACIHALVQLPNPEPFQPRPLPEKIKRLIFRKAVQGKPEA